MPREPVDASILNLYGCGSPDWAPVEVSIIPTSNPTDFLSNGYFILNGEGGGGGNFRRILSRRYERQISKNLPIVRPSFGSISKFENSARHPTVSNYGDGQWKTVWGDPDNNALRPLPPPLPQVIRSSQYRPFRRSNTPTLPITRRSYFANYNDRPVDSHYAKRRHACSCDTGSPTNERASQLRAHTAKEVTNPVVRHDYSSNGVDGRLVCVNVCVCVRAVSNRN